jgi:hypothetical protein
VSDTSTHLRLISEVVLSFPTYLEAGKDHSSSCDSWPLLSTHDLEQLESLAASNNVVLRFFEPIQRILSARGDTASAARAASVVERERSRIAPVIELLAEMCATLDQDGCPVTIINSLDHWPDVGRDLEFYSEASPARLIALMSLRFKAKPELRGWADRVANTWTFTVPRVAEPIRVHVGRLGQMGEQCDITRSLSSRAQAVRLGDHLFRVAAPEDRIIFSCLQRMYANFYLRLCDIVDNAQLVESGAIDFSYLRSLSSGAGLWKGIATYLTIISEYVAQYRGTGVSLPRSVTRGAKFGASKIEYGSEFLRIPILPYSAGLYASELRNLLFRGGFRNSLRLGLLPCLATASVLGFGFSGDWKSIW